jgi:DNA processing protein
MDACEGCLRRTWLLGRLAAHIDRVVSAAAGTRARELLALGDDELVSALGGESARAHLAEVRALRRSELRDPVGRAGCWTLCHHDPGYPGSLHDLGGQKPAALLGRGDSALLGGLDPGTAVTIVGSRRASAYGSQVARELGRLLGAAGISVVSGLARGIDSEAHRGALEGGGMTVAVLGGGPEGPREPHRARLCRRVVERGAVVSELPPGTPSYPWTFPARNRIMAALAGMTIVVEAAERSGSLITAGMAQDLGRDVGAVPGPVTSWLSSGANGLLAEGAKPIRDAQDVLDALVGAGAKRVRGAGPPLEDGLRAVLEGVERGHRTCDALAVATGVDPAGAAIALTELELLGYLRSDRAGSYARTPLVPPGMG